MDLDSDDTLPGALAASGRGSILAAEIMESPDRGSLSNLPER
jgi:hypothetical protein